MSCEPVNVKNLDSKDLITFLDSFDYVFSDCDGVLWLHGKPMEGAQEFFSLMKQRGKKLHYVSNNSLKPEASYEKQFLSVGISDGYKNLTIPSIAAVEYLKSINFNKYVYCVTAPQTLITLQENGFKCKYGPDVGEDSVLHYVKYFQDDDEIGAVVVDSDYKMNIPKLYKAVTYLKRPDVILINGATDRCVPLGGINILGITALTDAILTESKRKPIQLGKPGREFGENVMKKTGVTDPGKVLFIGDMIDSDVGFGKANGFQTLLVLSTITKEDMESHLTLKPDYYTESLQIIVDKLKNKSKV